MQEKIFRLKAPGEDCSLSGNVTLEICFLKRCYNESVWQGKSWLLTLLSCLLQKGGEVYGKDL